MSDLGYDNTLRLAAASLWDLLAETAATDTERECARHSAATYRWTAQRVVSPPRVRVPARTFRVPRAGDAA